MDTDIIRESTSIDAPANPAEQPEKIPDARAFGKINDKFFLSSLLEDV